MDLFKNGVGRPSNETIKKRRIFYVAITFAVILVLGLGTYFLTNINNSSNKLKGNAVGQQSDIQLSISFNDSQIKKGPSISPYGEYRYGFNAYGTYTMQYDIKNGKNYTIYYRILDGSNKILKEGSIKSGQSTGENSVQFTLSEQYNSNGITFMFDKSKSYVNGNREPINDFRYPFDYYSAYFDIPYIDGANTNNSSFQSAGVNYDGNFYTLIYPYGKVYLKSTLYNYSNKNYYYKWFVYNNDEISENAYTYSTKCTMLKKNKTQNFNETITLNEKTSISPGVLKLYKSLLSCNDDKKGISNQGVLGKSISRFVGRTSPLNVYGMNNTYKVNYSSNGGNGKMFYQEIHYSTAAKLEKNVFSKEGYKFKGWIAQKNNNGKTVYYGYNSSNKVGWYQKPSKYYYYKDQQVVSKTVPAGETVTMVAQWEKASNSNVTNATTTVSSNTNKKEFTKGQKVNLVNATVYRLSTTNLKKASGVTNEYYIWNSEVKKGRIRITTKQKYAGNIFRIYGWVNINDIK